MPKNCPKCNRSSDEARFFGQFCEYCTKDRLAKRLPECIKVEKCKRCGRVRTGEAYVNEVAGAIEEIANKQFKPFRFKIKEVKEGVAYGTVFGMEGSERVGINADFKIKHEKKLCHQCYLISADYYEGVIQLRGRSQKVHRQSDNIKEFFAMNGSFVTKTVQKDGGLDLYVGNKKLANAYMQLCKLKPVMSYTLAGLQRGKKVYKNTYALHLD